MRPVLLMMAILGLCAGQVYRIETVAGEGQPGFTGDGGPAQQAQLNEPVSVAIDSAGRLIIADKGNNRIRRLESDRTIQTIAGNGEAGNSGDGDVAVAAAITVSDITVDRADNLYIAGGANVRVVRPDGTTATVASGLESANAVATFPDGTLIVADGSRLQRIDRSGNMSVVPTGLDPAAPISDVAIGRDGTIYFVADRVYRMDTAGAVTPVGIDVPVDSKTQIAVDQWGHLYLSGARIWKVIGSTVHVLAGTGEPGFSGDGGPSAAAQVNGPSGIAVDAAGNTYFADSGNHRVRVLMVPAAVSVLPVYPVNGVTDVWPSLSLQWTPVPLAGGYEVHLGTGPDASELAATVEQSSFRPSGLQFGTTYYWRIVARAGSLPLATSETWSFRTSDAAKAPEVPTNPTPSNFTLGQPTSLWLTWQGRAASRFEVHFGEGSEPSRIAIVEGNRFRIDGLAPETTYYWKVVGINETTPGGGVSSAVWRFTTSPAGGYPYVVSTVAGTTLPTADGANAKSVVLELPRRPAVDNSGAFYFIDGGRRVRRVTPDQRIETAYTPIVGGLAAIAVGNTGTLYVASGENVVRITRAGQRALVAGQAGTRGYGGDGGPGAQALFNGISSIAVSPTGTIYVADAGNARVRAITISGSVTTFAGNGSCGEGERVGAAADVPLCYPTEVAVDSEGNVLVYERGRIVRVRTDGWMEPFAGTGTAGYTGDGGPALEARVNASGGLAVDAQGNVYFADREAMVIRRIDTQGVITTVAGDPDPADGRAFGFFGDGLPGARARFAFPDGIAVAGEGNVFIADWYNHRIRRIDTNGFIDTVAGSDTATGDRGGATSAYLLYPTDVAVDGSGTIYVADSLNHRIRRVTAGRSMDTVAGTGIGAGRFSDAMLTTERVGRPAHEFTIDTLTGGLVEMDPRGTLLFTDSRFNWMFTDRTATVFGLSANGSTVEAIDSRVHAISGLVRGPSGEIFVSDTLGNRVIRIGADGGVSTVAGTGTAGYSGDGGPAVLAQLRNPGALSMSPEGELYIADFGRIRKVGRNGVISTVAIEHANGLAHDRLGNLFVSSNRFVYVLLPTGHLQRIAGRESAIGPDTAVTALDARIGEARGLAVAANGDILVADKTEHKVRRLTRNLPSAIVVASGGTQTPVAGERLEQPIVVRVMGRAGLPVPGVTLRFANADRGLTGLPGSARTNAQGQVSIQPTAAMRSGETAITVTSPGLAPVEIRLTVQ